MPRTHKENVWFTKRAACHHAASEELVHGMHARYIYVVPISNYYYDHAFILGLWFGFALNFFLEMDRLGRMA